MTIRFISVLFFVFVMNSALARVQKVTDIYLFPEDGRIFYFYVQADDTTGMAQKAYLEFQDDKTHETKYKEFSFDKIINGGEVIYRSEGRDVVIFHCPKCNVKTGGTLKVKYLYNAIYGKYKALDLNLRLDQSKTWWALRGNEKVKTLNLWPNKLFGKVVGISKITVNGKKAKSNKSFFDFLLKKLNVNL